LSDIEQTELEPETTQAPVDTADIPAAAFSAVEEVIAVAAPESQVVSPQPGKWYVVHSYAGYERRVKQNIENRKLTLEGGDQVFQIEVPMEETIEIKNGQRKLVSKVRIPGYVLVAWR
jgi:transcription termination/antitermination protein NusG